jgi:nocturnin
MENNIGPDGSAIFFKMTSFQIVSLSCEKIIIDNDINAQVFIILRLKHKQSGNLLTVVCLHLKSKDEYHQKREAQIKEILKTLKFHIEGSELILKKHPLIICGDFNGEPFENFYKNIMNNEDFNHLKDAYMFENENKQATTIKIMPTNKSMIRRAIDYIFYNQENLVLNSYLELPKNDDLIEQEGLPNLKYSSDHLSLVCDFEFKN